MGVLNMLAAYGLADTLGMELDIDKVTGKITGEASREIVIGNLKVPVKMKIVGSRVVKDGVLVLARCTGNLGLMIFSTDTTAEPMSMALINLAKCSRFDEWFEKNKPGSMVAAVQFFGAAVTKSFVKTGKTSWAAA